MERIKVQVTPLFERGIKEGNPLLYKDSLENVSRLEEGQIIEVENRDKQFLGLGYYAIQNKGIGWILTNNSNEAIDEMFFQKKLADAIEKRKALFQDPHTTAFRLFNGEGDGIGGFTLDLFNGFLLFQWYSKGIYRFKDKIIAALQTCMEFKGIYEKKRFDQKGMYVEDDDFVMGEKGDFPITIKENGISYSVDLNDGAMVGIFLDQRDVRKMICDKYAKGKDVLNTFSYTGAFSVAAAVGGSKSTTSVDLANRSRAKTAENFQLNNIDLEKQKIIVEDVFHYFKYAVKKNLLFDMVILDPPSFARSKKHTFSAAKDYTNLLKEAIAITKDNGIIVASTNCSTFDMKKFKKFILDAFEKQSSSYEIVEEFGLPKDFRYLEKVKESNYLKVVFIKKRK
ncbi:class I SAM-dependent rRNA methyltransferase [Niallia sp. NCCP-28]|uniref:class I SAM-dependent rRNA methyltransferase n=1 Tax=Niallia sp. NCCP-28 TaxID=2934712 RepID=UPI002086790E|nr:class I SAM-dependent rRNA methyltransferase [Niallia sp. NCCP-28]GKU80730.1 methyltransferase [Niallia sp. NCCP-28]